MVAEADGGEGWVAPVPRDLPIPGDQFKGVAAGCWHGDHQDEWGLPLDCPVVPLGFDGDVCWFIDTAGQLRVLHYKEFSINAIGSLFAGWENYLYWGWPRKNAEAVVVSWRAEKVAETLRHACYRKGPWTPQDQQRGRGAWTLRDGSLVYNSGTRLYVAGQPGPLGEIEGNVYTVGPQLPRPWARPLTGLAGPAREIYPVLSTWAWQRPDIDPVLFLGWNALAMVCGAAPWRPSLFVTGDSGRGKTSLQILQRGLHGSALLYSANASSAGVYQQRPADALPVVLDEFEAGKDEKRKKEILELARQSSDNQLILRGGADHKGVSFKSQSAFAFYAINAPSRERQDRNRMIELCLDPLPEGATEPALIHDDAALERLGRQALRKMIDNWHRFAANWRAYREVLMAGGHNQRGSQTYGAVLACADLLIDTDAEALELPMGPAAEDLMAWAERCSATAMIGFDDTEDNWRACLNHLITVAPETWRNTATKRPSIGQVLQDFYHPEHNDDQLMFAEARRILQLAGLTLVAGKQGAPPALFIPNDHPVVRGLFKDTKWQGEPGAAIWPGALRQAPRELWTVERARVGGAPIRGTLFAVPVVIDDGREGS